ncbi:hypothetical protein POTOM_010142 [Populus tomentosa]|uniref:Uncharacterized protein n=1 Tax=Populus tomentosa TaxID=118781 RepID=A0A8X8A803_POPTO|nr:hypothetical protein POTOM_010142 [Populus tomentosa]
MSSDFLPLETISPTETLEIENGLSLVPRVKLNFTVHPSLPSSATKPIDEWKLKRSLIEFAKTSLSITIPEDDLEIRRFKDVKKRKRDDPVAHGSLSIRDLGFLNSKKRNEEESDDLKILGKKFRDWRDNVVEKMDQMEVNLQGEKYRLSVAVPESDDFEGMKKLWEEFYAFANKGYVRGGRQEPDTIVMKGVPSRWVAEPRVSSKPSMLVTHTVFSTFGKISIVVDWRTALLSSNVGVGFSCPGLGNLVNRPGTRSQFWDRNGYLMTTTGWRGVAINVRVEMKSSATLLSSDSVSRMHGLVEIRVLRNLNVTEDDDQDKDADENGGDIISGLHCKIVVQFEKHRDFYNALKVLCGRSLQKQGSRLKADYEITWAKDGFFRNSRSQARENSRVPAAGRGHYRNEAPRHEAHLSQFTADDTRRKRFKVRTHPTLFLAMLLVLQSKMS